MTSRGGPQRRVRRLAGPVIASNLAVPLPGAVDAAVVGPLEHADAIAAVALGATLAALYPCIERAVKQPR